MKSNTYTVLGIPMRWLDHGEGQPVVFVHGIPTSPDLWRFVLPLVEGARSLAFEMVGYGESIPAGRGRDISVSAQADYLLAWLDSLGVESAVLVGHDLGGGVVQNAAVRQPARCAGLLLTNSIAYDSWPIPSVKALRAAGALLRHTPDAALKPVLRVFFARGHDDPDRAAEALEVHFRHYAHNEGAQDFVRQVRALNVRDTLDVAPALPDLRVPARVVWGDDDQFQKLAYGERLARDLGAQLVHIPGGKHFTPEDHPDVIAETLMGLLREVRTRVGGRPAAARARPVDPSDLDPHLRRGFEAIAGALQVMPDDAPPRVATLYRQIRGTLRVPVVSSFFRVLATDGRALQGEWAHVATVAGTRGFEFAADELRALAAPTTPRRAIALGLDEDTATQICAFTDTVHYELPKLLLVATLLDPAARSWDPWAPPGDDPDTSPLPFGIAPGTVDLPLLDPRTAKGEIANLFEDIQRTHGHPIVSSWFRAMAAWPDALAALWQVVRPGVLAPEFAVRRQELVRQAAALASWLPDPESAAPRLSDHRDAIISAFRQRILPDLLLDISMVKEALEGKAVSGTSRFSVTRA